MFRHGSVTPRTLPHEDAFWRATLALILAAVLLLASTRFAAAFNYVADANGTYWGVQDVDPPRVDTGSIRATQIAPGTSGSFSTSISGYGGIKVLVETDPAPRFNGELMRGFGLVFDGVDRFTTTQSVDMGGVSVSRAVYVNRAADWTRWLDTFTNATGEPLVVKVAFGGQSGIGASGNNSSVLVTTASGDDVVTEADAWVEYATPLSGGSQVGGPQVVVLGTPSTPEAPFAGAIAFAGNWLHETFTNPLVYGGHEGNFQGYVSILELAPGESKSLLHFLVLGPRNNDTTAPDVRAAAEASAAALVAAPAIDGLTSPEICSIVNFDDAALVAAGFDPSGCPAASMVAQPAVPAPVAPVTTSPYDVVAKTIADLRADLEAGVTTSQEITRAYLDRIAVYDEGQFGFNAFEIVAADAMEQALAADVARAGGASGPLLGIPIGIKNLFDTYDMPTTNGSMTFEGFLPAKDAFQVARLREAGAVLIGKTALEEYATSGHYSNDAWGQVWNAFKPSNSPLASSGGSGSAVALSMCAAALGSQTGDSLYAPASAASLVTLRGTDGLQSGTGVMPLSWLTDFGGAMTRTVSDLADMLNVLAGTDPDDPATAPADAMIPDDWRSVLEVDALQGKRIGYIPAVWVDPFQTEGTIAASTAALEILVQAGATIVEMGTTVGGTNTPPVPPDSTTGNLTQEGWMQYIDSHPELAAQGFQIFSAVDVSCSQKKVAYVRADPSACLVAPAPRMTQAEIDAKRAQRVLRQQSAKAWMDTAGADGLGVDAVVYPGLQSYISLNDGGGSRAAFGRRDTPGAANGIPTVVFPAGRNDHGEPVALQLLGRAWDDDELVGMAYAFEHHAKLAGAGKIETDTAPALQFEPTPSPSPSPTPSPSPSPSPSASPSPSPTPAPVAGAFVQLVDVTARDRDTFAVRGRMVAAPGSDPLGDALASGVTLAVWEGAGDEPVLVDRVTFAPGQCRAVLGESRSLSCKDRVSRSYFRLRGKAATPQSFRLTALVKRREFAPGAPFVVPLAAQVAIGEQSWLAEASSCSVARQGERTTCKGGAPER